MSCQCFSGITPTEGLGGFYSSGRITLRYSFDPLYNGFEIGCCKLDQLDCYIFVNNRGLVNSLYQGRVFSSISNGVLEVIITNLSELDAGTYRCGVVWIINTYQEVHVTVSGKILCFLKLYFCNQKWLDVAFV